MFKEARRVCETIKGYKKRGLSCGQTINISATILLGNTLRVLVTSYRLPWQDVRSTSRHSYFQLLLIIWKTKSVTYHFYFFVGKLQKSFNFSDSMTKSYLADFKKQRKKAFYGLQKIVLDSFTRNFSVRNAIMNDACKPKNCHHHRYHAGRGIKPARCLAWLHRKLFSLLLPMDPENCNYWDDQQERLNNYGKFWLTECKEKISGKSNSRIL